VSRTRSIRRVPCVGGVLVRADGRLLLVRRGTEPARGQWSVPGGRREPGETDEAATARELHEETGLVVVVDELLGVVERHAPDGAVYVIRDYACRLPDEAAAGPARAGDDADEVGWFSPAELSRLDCVPGLVASLREWGVLPA
jgi:8-oxo-dGTP diphosphatase